ASCSVPAPATPQRYSLSRHALFRSSRASLAPKRRVRLRTAITDSVPLAIMSAPSPGGVAWPRRVDARGAIGPLGQRPSAGPRPRSEEHTSELQTQSNLVCRLLLEKI